MKISKITETTVSYLRGNVRLGARLDTLLTLIMDESESVPWCSGGPGQLEEPEEGESNSTSLCSQWTDQISCLIVDY